MEEYRNLEIEIFDAQGKNDVEQFKVRVFSSPVGGQKYTEATKIRVRPGLRKRLRRLDRRSLLSSEMIELGVELGRYLFPSRVKDCMLDSLRQLATDEGLRVQLRLESFALANVPWEYAYLPGLSAECGSPGGFLVLDAKISLVRREVQMWPPGDLTPVEGPLRFVMLMASPCDYPPLKLDIEREKIEEVLSKLPDFNPEFYSDATLDILEDALFN